MISNKVFVFFLLYAIECQQPLNLMNHHYFPERVNVSFAQIVNDKNIKLNVWERGAGQTKACGTAACATTVAANIKSFSKNECVIHFKSGSLKIDYNKNVGEVFMSGRVSKIEKISFNY